MSQSCIPNHPFPVECSAVSTADLLNGTQFRFQFDNGLGVSVVRHDHSIGNQHGLWEVAVLCRCGELIYTSDHSVMPEDVIGNMTEQEVAEVIAGVAHLPNVSCSKPDSDDVFATVS